jgi:hypothetical protein
MPKDLTDWFLFVVLATAFIGMLDYCLDLLAA